MIITVTWMDGLSETFRCESWALTDACLWLKPEPSLAAYGKEEPARCIPLYNVRIWTAE